ncbi:hypothetical protein JHS3_13780 [Jeongeupia sp. HS-3]|uniref:bacterioferritin-associated ferredoxin n=1 Tax=Jeongeupia sp. HS-3 TaxID=1009682 RepID=UPI0018A5EB7A|nr:bacterioferritin-associated ferredoxin [Jeongeupia sp. HS-3]BCL75642.1 hypothetical protein JHS3_13780 [Jeongeupia sp. HS-3]
MYVCVCNSVTDKDIHRAVSRGVRTFVELKQETQVATCCGKCASCAKHVLKEAIHQHAREEHAVPAFDGLAAA